MYDLLTLTLTSPENMTAASIGATPHALTWNGLAPSMVRVVGHFVVQELEREVRVHLQVSLLLKSPALNQTTKNGTSCLSGALVKCPGDADAGG